MEDQEIQKHMDEKEVMSREELTRLATNQEYPLRDRALMVAVYLSNSRISEIINRLKKSQIHFTEISGLDFMIFTELYTEKNSVHPPRTIPVRVDREEAMINVLKLYIQNMQEFDIIFPVSRVHAWRIIKRLTGHRCHYLRHCRLTHLQTDYNVMPEGIRRMAGWKSTEMLAVYSHLAWRDLAQQMM